MRIVYLNPSGQLGGAECNLLELLAGLRAAEPDWPLHLVVSADGPLVARATALGVAVTVVPFSPRLARLGDSPRGARGVAGRAGLARRLAGAAIDIASYRRALRGVLHGLRPDIVHTNGSKMHVLGTWTAPRGVPVVWHVHDYLGTRPVMRRLMRARARRCAAAIANSASVADDLRAVCGERLPIHVVHNAVDLERYAAAGPVADLDALAAMRPAAPGTIRVGLVATLAWWKGHETFLRALALLPADVTVRGYVIGGPIYVTDDSQRTLDALRAIAAELGLADRVGFTGFVDDPATAMRALDVVVHASTQPEPFGLVIAEAMACARAVIVSRAGGAAEITEDGTDCLGHPPGDARALAHGIRRLALDAPLRAALGASARLTAERLFARARLAAAVAPIYRDAAIAAVGSTAA